MTARQFGEFTAVTLLMAAGTWYVGWWTVPVIAAAWGFARAGDRWLPLLSATAGMLSWLLLLFLPSSPGAVSQLAEVAGQAMGVGAGPLLVLTLVFPALLAVSAASLSRAVAPHHAARAATPTSSA
jgi:hypothetical protein